METTVEIIRFRCNISAENSLPQNTYLSYLFQSNTALVITHVPTNKNLAAENVVVQTLFGPVSIPDETFYTHQERLQHYNGLRQISNKNNGF